MSMPRMASPRRAAAAAASATTLIPPALPRPPIRTWAFTTAGYPWASAAATTSSTVRATVPLDAGTPGRGQHLLALVLEQVHSAGGLVVLGRPAAGARRSSVGPQPRR